MSRSVQDHLLDGEQVINHIVTDSWAWISTDQRLIKYRRDNSGREELFDVSYDEISGISLAHSGPNRLYLLLAIAVSVVVLLISANTPEFLPVIVIAAIPYWMYRNSGTSYFEFRGSGLVSQEPEKWRIDQQNVSENEATEFVRSVRERI